MIISWCQLVVPMLHAFMIMLIIQLAALMHHIYHIIDDMIISSYMIHMAIEHRQPLSKNLYYPVSSSAELLHFSHMQQQGTQQEVVGLTSSHRRCVQGMHGRLLLAAYAQGYSVYA